jgi:hypothetical protein
MFRFCTSHAYSLLHEAHHFQRGYSPKSTNQPVITTYHSSISPRNECINLHNRFPIPSCHSTPCCSPPPPFWAHQPTSTVAYPAPAAACRKRRPIVVSGTSALCNNRKPSRSRDRTTRASAWSLERCVHCSLVYLVSLQSKEAARKRRGSHSEMQHLHDVWAFTATSYCALKRSHSYGSAVCCV